MAVCRLFLFLQKYQKLSSGRSGVSMGWRSNTQNCLSEVPGYLLLLMSSEALEVVANIPPLRSCDLLILQFIF